MDSAPLAIVSCGREGYFVRHGKWILSACLLAALAFAGQGMAAAYAPLESKQIAPDFKLLRIAPDVYAFIAGNTTHLIEDGNTTVVVTSEGVVVVDASSTHLSRRHLNAIRKLTDKPVRYLINTHWHYDHVFGNHVYAEVFPGLRIIANDYTARISDLRNPESSQASGRASAARRYSPSSRSKRKN